MGLWGRKGKFNARKTTVDGITFASALEAAVYDNLKLRAGLGEIKDIQLQDSVRLKEKCEACGDGPVNYKVDFSAVDVETGDKFWIEAKGVKTRTYKKRERLWREQGPGRLEVWQGSWRCPRLVEVIIPGQRKKTKARRKR